MSNTTYKSKVGYQSPIKLNQTLEWEEGTADKISKYIAGEIDNLILESCMKVVCDVNEEELLKALQYDRGQYEKGYADGKRDAVVRCGECRLGLTSHGIPDGLVLCLKPYTERGHAIRRADWFCADGERREI